MRRVYYICRVHPYNFTNDPPLSKKKKEIKKPDHADESRANNLANWLRDSPSNSTSEHCTYCCKLECHQNLQLQNFSGENNRKFEKTLENMRKQRASVSPEFTTLKLLRRKQ